MAAGRTRRSGKADASHLPARGFRYAGPRRSSTTHTIHRLRSARFMSRELLRFDPEQDTRLDVGLIKIQAGDDASESGFDCESHANMPDPNAWPSRSRGRYGRSADRRRPHRLIRLTAIAGLDPGRMPGDRLLRRPNGLPRRPAEPDLGQARRYRRPGGDDRDPRRAGHRLESWRPRHRDRHHQASESPTKEMCPAFACIPETEERTIRSHRWNRTLARRSSRLRACRQRPDRGEVANLSRNVVVESADPADQRGHTMYHRHSTGSISYAEFRHLGKSKKLGQVQSAFPPRRRHDAGDRRWWGRRSGTAATAG